MSLKSRQKYFGNKTMFASIFILSVIAISAAHAGVCDVVKDGLVACYPFNGNANDESGNGNNGTINGATPLADKSGNADSAYSFNGTTDYIYIGKPVQSSVAATDAITLAAWIKPSAYPISNTDPKTYVGLIIGCQCDACGSTGYAIHLDGRNWHGGIRGGIHFQIGLENIGYTDTDINEGATNAAVPLNQWSHIVATWKSGDTKKVYINGQLVTNWTTIWTGNIKYNSNTELSIGRQPDLGRYFNGSVDDVRIYNRAISEAEIRQLYDSGSCAYTQAQLDQAVKTEQLKWDADGDGRIGLEDIIRMLQVLAGLRP
ncbi:MAG: hypothetical protein BWK80_44550 [Desulfobacteraceae bacterium IS3]|nr:MAG: hypothetical protein BWK80_44550 [Desulfobacteraceae bacterium IS3]